MSNSFGRIFRFTTWGESHGPAIGSVVDGVPGGIPLSEDDLQPALDRRRPGQSKQTTQRKELDQVAIQSGVFDGHTTGTSIGLVIQNTDQRSKDYGEIANQFRPGHADYTYWQKYGNRDYRGGGRSSARETAMRVAAGGVAMQVLRHYLGGDVTIRAALVQMGQRQVSRSNWDWDEVSNNDFFCPDKETAALFADDLAAIRKAKSSVGAVIEVEAMGIPAGLGEPVYGKLDADLATAMMSINAVKGVEIGAGFGAAALDGITNADEMLLSNDSEQSVQFASNHAGGVLGGISTGQPIVLRFAVKPTSSILTPRRSVDRFGRSVDVMTKGRHDPCVGIRAVPVGEAMMAIVLADHLLAARANGTPMTPRPWDVR